MIIINGISNCDLCNMFPHRDKNIVTGTMPDILLSSNDFIEIINNSHEIVKQNCISDLPSLLKLNSESTSVRTKQISNPICNLPK